MIPSESGGFRAHAVELSAYLADHESDRETIEAMARHASAFLEHYAWCDEVLETLVGLVKPGILGVFLLRIRPARDDVAEWLWVVVGDLPPAYFTVDACPSPTAVVESYVAAMREWVAAAFDRRSVSKLIPVNVAPTPHNAEQLRVRLDYLEQTFLDGGDPAG